MTLVDLYIQLLMPKERYLVASCVWTVCCVHSVRSANENHFFIVHCHRILPTATRGTRCRRGRRAATPTRAGGARARARGATAHTASQAQAKLCTRHTQTHRTHAETHRTGHIHAFRTQNISSVGSGAVSLFIINYYCQNINTCAGPLLLVSTVQYL